MKKIFLNNIKYPDSPSERFYFESYRGAWVRAGSSLFMWFFALGAYFFDVIKINNFIGISCTVAFLILMNPPLLFILHKLKKIYILNFFTLLISLLEIAAYTTIFYFLGGIRALWLCILYSLAINYLGIVGRRGASYILATMCSVLMAVMVAMEYTGLLPSQDPAENTRLLLSTQIVRVATIAGCLYLVAFFSAYGGKLLKQSRRKLRDRNLELEEKNRELEHAEKELRAAHINLEKRVKERTAELGKVNAMLSMEIDDRRQAEEKLQESINRLDEAQAITHLGSWEFNIQTNVLVWSKEMCRIYGYDREDGEIPYEVFVNAIHPDDCDRVITTVANAILSGRPYEIKYCIIRPSGEERTSLSRCIVIKDENNNPIRLLGTERDITEREKFEAEKQKLEEALRQSQKMEAIGTLAGGIAHEFNNVLAIIIGNAELASDDVPEQSPVKEQLNEILTASFRARDVVQGVLSFARQSKTGHQAIDIRSVIIDEIKLLRASISSAIEIRSNIKARIDIISGDPTQIKQVLMNLSNNAVYAMSEKEGVLEIGLENISLTADDLNVGPDLAPGNFVKLTVKDNGTGIDPKNIKRIFEPYFTTKKMEEGTGIGLAVVYGIVSEGGGAIRVSSEINKGTTFEVFFPAISESLPEPEINLQRQLPRGSEHILFVDDEESIVRLNRGLLQSLGYTIETDTDPVNALDLFSNNPGRFDLVITDMTMPGMSGYAFAKEILALKPGLPIIICSGYSEKITKDKVKGLSIRKYLEKPVNLHKLAFAVREALDGK